MLPSMVRIGLRTCARVAVTALPAFCATLIAGCNRAAGPDSYNWRGPVTQGSWVRITNVNGPVRVARANGTDVVVTARRTYRGRRPEPVRMFAERSGNDVRICAVNGANATGCSSRSRGVGILTRILRRYSPTTMEFTVAIPNGVHVQATTVNGSVIVADAAGEVEARSTNGDVTVAGAGGPFHARSVNGSVLASVSDLAPGAPVELRSTNGSVTAMLPPSLAAALDLSTTNGSVTSDFPLAPTTRRARRLHGVIGGGGNRTVELHTVNGNVRLEQAR